MEGMMDENEISKIIVGSAIEVHREFGGPGLLENLYEEALCRELVTRGLKVQRQFPVNVKYKGQELGKRLVLDLLVENKVIVEVKSVEKHNPLYEAQLLTYLRTSHKKLGLLVNFGERYVTQGVKRIVNGL
jgi:GxxExxY protein